MQLHQPLYLPLLFNTCKTTYLKNIICKNRLMCLKLCVYDNSHLFTFFLNMLGSELNFDFSIGLCVLFFLGFLEKRDIDDWVSSSLFGSLILFAHFRPVTLLMVRDIYFWHGLLLGLEIRFKDDEVSLWVYWHNMQVHCGWCTPWFCKFWLTRFMFGEETHFIIFCGLFTNDSWFYDWPQ